MNSKLGFLNKVMNYQAEPTPARFHADNSLFRGIMGPVGSGKSVSCVIEGVRRSMEQAPNPDGIRRSRGVIVRNTYPELKSTTIKTWQEWVPNEVCKLKYDTPINGHIFEPMDDGTILDLEVYFLSLDREDDIKKLLSLEITWAWVNEAREIRKAMIDGLIERCGRFPPKADGAPITWSGVFADTNPPPTDSWWYRLAELERPDGWAFFRQPGALIPMRDEKGHIIGYRANPNAENVQNQQLGFQYWMRQVSGRDPAKVWTQLCGQYGQTFDGKPVYDESWQSAWHVSPVPLQVYRGIPLWLGWDFGLCYSDDTEVMTMEGWKFFKDVDVEKDLIATRDPVTGRMSYAKAAFKVDREYHGEMLEWSSTELNVCVTPEHRVPFTFRDSPGKVHWESAEWLADHMSGHHYVDLCSEWVGVVPESIPFGMTIDSFAEFMGIWLAEGSKDTTKVMVYQKDQKPEIQRILDATGLPWVWGGERWTCNRTDVAQSGLFFGKAQTKRVPRVIKDAPIDTIRKFIMAYTIGDGHIRVRENGSEEHTIFTTSKGMADDLMELCQKAGWNSSIRIVKPQISVIVENGEERKITCSGGFSICVKKRAKRAELLKRNFKRVDYHGRIYCLNVPFHVLYVRRGGKPSWNGNTPACVVGQVSPTGQLRILREFFCERGGIKQFAQDTVKPALTALFPTLEFWSVGDPAGTQAMQADSELTCLGMLAMAGIPTIPAPTNLFEIRREVVIERLGRLAGSEPAFIVDPSCRMIIEGFDGGYHFKRVQISGTDRFHDAPDKNKFSHCLARGTKVSTTKGLVNIEDIIAGDIVLTRNGACRVSKSWMTSKNAEVYQVNLSDGRSFCATSEHKVASRGLWLCVDALQYGEVLNSINERNSDKWEEQANIQYKSLMESGITERQVGKRAVKVVGVKLCDYRTDVFDLTVEGDHEFYANGILVHNCADALQYLVLGVDRVGSDVQARVGGVSAAQTGQIGAGSVARWDAMT